jgi:hypothetical protein
MPFLWGKDGMAAKGICPECFLNHSRNALSGHFTLRTDRKAKIVTILKFLAEEASFSEILTKN